MKKFSAILALGMILYGCTDIDKPDQLNLEEQTPSLNATGSYEMDVTESPVLVPKGNSEDAKILSTFTPINNVGGTYTTRTTLLDISNIACSARLNSVTDGTLTVDFTREMDKRQVNVCGWGGDDWGSPPAVEGPIPHILFSLGRGNQGIWLSTPVSTFGFEMMPNRRFTPFTFIVSFYNQGIYMGSSIREVTSTGGAKLFAASTNLSFDYIVISVDASDGYAMGQIRYTLADDKNPFTVAVKPDDCENPVNVTSRGVIPVGILASMDFNVNDIDLSTVRLNGVAPKMSSIADLGGFYNKEEACDCNPSKMDGIMDLDLKFDTQEIVASLGEVSDGERVTVSLSFNTKDGKSWTGEDCIRIIKKGKPGR